MHSLETQEIRTWSRIFSEHMPFSEYIFSEHMIQGEMYVLRWQLQLLYAAKYILQDLRFFVLVVQWKVLTKEFSIKVAGCYLPTTVLPNTSFFCRVSFSIFDKKCRTITFRWLLLFIAFTQAVFTEKVCFIETTSFNYSFTETWSIQRNLLRHFLVDIHC